jgi:hypothetical protein
MTTLAAAAAAVYAAFTYVRWARDTATALWDTWETLRAERLAHSLRAFRGACDARTLQPLCTSPAALAAPKTVCGSGRAGGAGGAGDAGGAGGSGDASDAGGSGGSGGPQNVCE